MAPDDHSGARPAPVVLRIKLRYDDLDTMVQRFAVNVGKTGLFLPTKSIQPIGSEIKFELRLQTDQPVLVGLGRVKASREPDPENPKATFGIAVELMRVTRESRDLILKMLERRKQLGLADVGIPMPADIDAARRADFVESGVGPRDSGAVPAYIPTIDSSPASAPFTAPRRQTGPIAVQKIVAVEPLAPEAPRKRRVLVAELIASASGPIVGSFVDDLEAEVDVAAVLARARALAGSDLDGELEALRDAAAPITIGIEDASAELARQLGGAAVRKSARWAPPPPTTDVESRDGAKGDVDAKGVGNAKGDGDAKADGDVVARDGDGAAREVVARDGDGAARDVVARDDDGAARDVVARDDEGDAARETVRDIDRAAREAAIAKVDGEAAIATVDGDVAREDGAVTTAIDEQAAVATIEPIARVGAVKAAPLGGPDKVARVTTTGEPPTTTMERPPEHVPDAPKHTPMPSRRPQRISARQRLKIESATRAADDEAAREFERGRERERERERELRERDERETRNASEPVAPTIDEDEVLFTRPRGSFIPEEEARVIAPPLPDSLIHDGADPAEFEDAHEVLPEHIHDEIHRLDEGDFEEVESTQVGQELPAVDPHAYASAARLDAELAAAEQEAASDNFGFDGGFALEEPPQQDFVMRLGAEIAGEMEEEEEEERQASLEEALAAAADDEEIVEIEDFEILAEADAADADLLGASAERPSESGIAPPEQLEVPPVRPSFLNRLELDDDSGYHVPPASGHFEDEFSPSPGELDPRVLSAGHALRAFEEPSQEYSDFNSDFNAPGTFTPVPRDPAYRPREQSYTDAEDFDAPHGNYGDPVSFDAPHGSYGNPSGFVPPDAFDQSDVISIGPQPGGETDDLETALEALDVDLDDLRAKPGAKRKGPIVRAGNNRNSGGMPAMNAPDDEPIGSSPTEEASVAAARTQAPPRAQRRASTEDGIEIDFDDE